LSIQFHYADNTSGSWSGTAHTTVSPGPKAASTPSATPASTPTTPSGGVQGISVSQTSSPAPAGGVQGITSAPNTGAHLPLGLGLGLVVSGLGLIGRPGAISPRRRG